MDTTDIVLVDEQTAQTAPAVHETAQLPRSIFAMTQDQFNRLSILAKMYSLSSFNKSNNPMSEGDFFLIMLKGVELGLMPTLAVDFINVISGKPVLDGKGMLALIYKSGLCESLEIDSQPEICTIKGKRKGQPEQVVTFSKADAMVCRVKEYGKEITLWEKGTWKNQPSVMLKWRAVSKFARQMFPDVIGGLYTKDEMEANVDVLEDGTEIMKPAPQQPQLQQPKPAQQPKPQQPANATTPKVEWGTEESINNLVEWAKKYKYGTNASELLSLTGKPDWKAFADGKQACEAIAKAHEQKAQAPASKPAPAPTQQSLTDAEGSFTTNLVTTIGDASSVRYLEFASGHLTARSYSRKETASKMAGILPDDELETLKTLEFDYEPYRLSRHFKVFYKVANNYNLVTRFEAVGTIDSHDTVDTTEEPPVLPPVDDDGDLDAFFPRGGK